jgi:phospholipase/carboxylesterase
MSRRTLLLSLLILAVSVAAALDPAEIDPLDPAAGEFLEADFDEYAALARQYYQEGDYLESARYHLAYLTGRPGDSTYIYNLACCFGLLGEAEPAARYLELAVDAGFEDAWLIAEDGDFDKVRDSEVFALAAETAIAEIEAKLAAIPPLHWTETPVQLPTPVVEAKLLEEGQPRTLIVALHGYGSNPLRFSRLAEAFGPEFTLACPRAPHPYSTSSVGFTWLWWTEDGELPGSRENAENYVLTVIEELREKYEPERVYLMGFSQGAGMTYDIALKNPQIFDGALPFGGWLDTEEMGLTEADLEAAAELPFFICHGEEDSSVPFEAGRGARELLEGYGYDVTFHAFAGGHFVPEEAVAAAVEWIKSLE